MIKIVDNAPVRPNSNVVLNAAGSWETIPVKIIKDIPLPIPLCVTCSPNHIKNNVPLTKVMTVINLKYMPGLVTALTPCDVMFSIPTATP